MRNICKKWLVYQDYGFDQSSDITEKNEYLVIFVIFQIEK